MFHSLCQLICDLNQVISPIGISIVLSFKRVSYLASDPIAKYHLLGLKNSKNFI